MENLSAAPKDSLVLPLNESSTSTHPRGKRHTGFFSIFSDLRLDCFSTELNHIFSTTGIHRVRNFQFFTYKKIRGKCLKCHVSRPDHSH